jgi:hypothetical protein
MNNAPDMRARLASIIAQIGGINCIGGAVRTFALLAALGFAAFMPFVAGYELFRVHAVASWPLVPARIVSATLEPSAFRNGVSSWRYRMVDLQTGAAIETGDMRPGDLPFSVVTWSTADADAAKFQARAGQAVNIRRSPDSTEFYPEGGDTRFMTGVLIICAVFWALVFWRRKNMRSDCKS